MCFDRIFPQEKASSVEQIGYVWKVIVDPTRKSDDPGVFWWIVSNDGHLP